MSRNIIFIPAYNGFDTQWPECIESWKHYCKRHDIKLIIANEKKEYDFEAWGNGCFEPWWDERLVELDYDKVILMDSDTMARWDAPNIFEHTKDKEICVVADAGGGATGGYHINQWIDFNTNIKMDPEKYFNTGFVFLSKEKYLGIKEQMPKYYEYWSSFYKNGNDGPNACEQTPVNLIANELYPNEITHLDFRWNNMVMSKYDDGSFINDSFIWHFTGPRMGGHKRKGEVITQIWEHIKKNYE